MSINTHGLSSGTTGHIIAAREMRSDGINQHSGRPGAQRVSAALGPGRDPGGPGSSPASGSLRGACFSLCLSLSHE